MSSTSRDQEVHEVALVLLLLFGLVTCRPQDHPLPLPGQNSNATYPTLLVLQEVSTTILPSINSTTSTTTALPINTTTIAAAANSPLNHDTNDKSASAPLTLAEDAPSSESPGPASTATAATIQLAMAQSTSTSTFTSSPSGSGNLNDTDVISPSASNESNSTLVIPNLAAMAMVVESPQLPPPLVSAGISQNNDETSTTTSTTSSPEPMLNTSTTTSIPESSRNSTNLNTNDKWEFDERGFRRCNAANSSALNKCLRLIIQDLRPRLKTGIPELNLPPVDPLRLQSVSFEHGSGPIKITATFRNVIAMGLGHFNKTEFEVDMKRRVLDYDLEIPQMQIIGDYELSGNLFFFPVGGKGNFAVNLQRITAKGQGKLGIVILNNRKTVQMNKIDIDLDIANVKVHLTNLFNGDPVWGNVINKFLNDNSKDIFDEIKPKIATQVSELVKSASNRALALLGADHFTDVKNTQVDGL